MSQVANTFYPTSSAQVPSRRRDQKRASKLVALEKKTSNDQSHSSSTFEHGSTFGETLNEGSLASEPTAQIALLAQFLHYSMQAKEESNSQLKTLLAQSLESFRKREYRRQKSY